jgi:L-lactate dehydrogenase complex protein LldE
MRVALFVTCLVDLVRPVIGFSAIKLLEHAGCEVVVPELQTCCGQPAFNAGDLIASRDLAEKLLNEFEGYEAVVVPSGSCGGMIKTHFPDLFRDQTALSTRLEAMAAKTWELTDFLVNVIKLRSLPDGSPLVASIAYHDSCSGLRELGVKQQPRELLALLPALTLAELNECEACCGFGGTFALKYGAISTAIVDEKCANIRSCGVDAVVLGDLGCMLNIEGRLRRTGDHTTQVLHVAQVLAGGN